MPLAKKTVQSKGNQGAQWGNTGSAGNIKHKSSEGAVDAPKPAKSSKRGRNKSIGRK